MHVTQAEREKRGTAHVEVVGKRGLAGRRLRPRAGGPLENGKTQNQPQGPHQQKAKEGQRAIDREESFSTAVGPERASDPSPGVPGRSKIQSRQTEAPYDGPRQDNGLECVPENDGDEQQSDKECKRAHDSLARQAPTAAASWINAARAATPARRRVSPHAGSSRARRTRGELYLNYGVGGKRDLAAFREDAAI